jgi:hypothetical protein
MNGLNAAQLFSKPTNSHYEKTNNSYFCIFGARHDAGLMREPASDSRNDDASDYDKYCAYVYATVVTVVTDASNHREHLLSRERDGFEGCYVRSGNPLRWLSMTICGADLLSSSWSFTF